MQFADEQVNASAVWNFALRSARRLREFELGK
jgi:hypothetical protein